MITRFRVQNYKALRDVSLELTPIHVLIGPNDSGKTSILEAIAALSGTTEGEIGSAFVGNWEGYDLVWRKDPELPIRFEAEIQGDFGLVQYLIACRFLEKSKTAHVVAESFLYNSQEVQLLASRQTRSRLARLDREPVPPEFLQLAIQIRDELRSAQFCRWTARNLALPAALDPQQRFRFKSDGFGLSSCLDDILGADRRRFDALEERFCKIFPQVKSIKLEQEEAYRDQKHDLSGPSLSSLTMLAPYPGKGIHFEFVDGQDIPARRASDGLLLILAYLAILYLPKPPRFLLVEEPENGIHPGRIKEVLKILRDLVSEQNHCQVILSTHSPYVVDLFQPNEVTLCHKEADGSAAVRRLSESKLVRDQLDIFSLGEIWMGEGEKSIVRDEDESSVGQAKT